MNPASLPAQTRLVISREKIADLSPLIISPENFPSFLPAAPSSDLVKGPPVIGPIPEPLPNPGNLPARFIPVHPPALANRRKDHVLLYRKPLAETLKCLRQTALTNL